MDFTSALDLGARERIAIVGGGGKTTIMYRLAAEAAARGRRAVVGGTTRFTPPRHGDLPRLVIVQSEEDPSHAVARALEHDAVVTCTTGRGDKGRWLPVSAEQAAAIAALPAVDLLVL